MHFLYLFLESLVSKSILLTPLADNFNCFKQNALNLVLNISSHFAYLVKVS